VLATGVGVALVVLAGADGIVWALVAQPILLLAIVAIAGRDIVTHLVPADRARTGAAFTRVIRTSLALMLTGFMTTAVQLAARVVVARHASLDEVGYFQAAWAVSVLYLGFVLGAMSQDYYPRIAELGANRAAVSQAVNEQAQVSFLLAGPAMLGLLTLSAPVVTAVAYVVSSAAYFIVLCIVANRLVGFAWDGGNVALMTSIAVMAVGVVAAHLFLEALPAMIVGSVITVVFGVYCLRRLLRELGIADKLRRRFTKR
jgi:PST family polysaccharide transporter